MTELLSTKLWTDALLKEHKKASITMFEVLRMFHHDLVESLKPHAMLCDCVIWQTIVEDERKSMIGIQKKNANHWVMTDSTNEHEITALLVRVARDESQQ